ncbi:hypothetical protein IU468_25655 [Nocardia farcinica]|uniref:hypothetical protein n=1 Tax=Nocardia farcinica TaxID=37329 RepID=UPI00189560D6|nr:hypothetical protein [Nocardia farcinica]MBF6259675.1 hypothetical protein [Nocardia farcinica]MBF6271185.1 hypothetical protein [Nocardia farcinica]
MLEVEHAFDHSLSPPRRRGGSRRWRNSWSRLGETPKPRKMDLMIAAVASANDLPLFTRNAVHFKGIEKLLTVVPV